MSRLLIKRRSLCNPLDKNIQTTGSRLRGIRIILLLVAFSVLAGILNNNLYAEDRDRKGMSVELNNNLYAKDSDGDGMSNEDEHYLAEKFLPNIWWKAGDRAIPEHQSPGDHWLLDCLYPMPHQTGFIGYDVVDLGFSDLIAVEYTVFLDFNDKRTFAKCDLHCFDNEAFTVLLQKCPSCKPEWKILSVECIGHHKSAGETTDRVYPPDIDMYNENGLLMAQGTHAIYFHKGVCERQFYGFEDCGYDSLINPFCVSGSYYSEPCSCSLSNLDCLDENINNPDCWAKRLKRFGLADHTIVDCPEWDVYLYPGPFCPCSTSIGSLFDQRKEYPPMTPIDVKLPPNLSYVDLFEKVNFTAEDYHLEVDDEKSFGNALVDSGMPLRLLNWPNASWWEQYYDLSYQRSVLNEERNFGLRRGIFWYQHPDWEGGDPREWYIGFVNEIESFKLYGLPGTRLVLYDCRLNDGQWEIDTAYSVSIPDGKRDTMVNDLGDLNNRLDYVTWGFGPLADAGNDTTVRCRETVILDARRSYEYALDPKMAFQVFDLGHLGYSSSFSYDSIWTYEWFDESDSNRLLGTGAVLETNSLEIGTHRVKLRVSGLAIPDPSHTDNTINMQVCDWCTVTVTIGEPAGIISGTVYDSTGGIHGVTVTAFNLDSNSITNPANFRVTCTDENGFYYFDSLAPGDFRVNIVTPLGFVCEQDTKYDSIAYSCWPPPVTINYQITPLSITPSQRSMGFWKHQVNAHLEGKGKPQVNLTELSSYINLISIHFNHNCANPVTIFQVPQPATQSDSLRALQKLLTVNKDGTMNDRAKQQLIALMLNVVSLKLHQRTQISMDSANVSQAITYCTQLITDSDPKNDEIAKDIADYINNGMMVGAGVIPLTTPNIMYKAEGQIAEAQAIPEEFSLSHNYPNPFNPRTQINYALPKDCNVKLTIFNVLGQKVKALVNEFQTAGFKTVHWDGKDDKGQDCASGIYFYKIQAGEFSQAKKMVIVR